MPLPPAPIQRAALLSPEAYDAPARTSRSGRKSASASDFEEGAALGNDVELFDRAGGGAPDALGEETASPQTIPGKLKGKFEAKSPDSRHKISADSYQNNSNQILSHAVSPAPAKSLRKKGAGPAKLFVLDTNVLLHDPMSLFRFEEHDIFLPMIVLEELDGHKKGMTEVARNARQISRSLDALAADGPGGEGVNIKAGLKLDATGHREATGRLFFQTQVINSNLPAALPQGKADNQILGVVAGLGEMHKTREVVLVSKDINMRVKARALGLPTDDYQNDKTLEDGDLLYTGSLALPADFWDKHGKTAESWQSGGHSFYRISGPIVPQLLINQFVYFESPGEPALYARVTEIRGKTAVLKTLKDYGHAKNAI